MLYVIIVAALLIFWLVAVDRPKLTLRFVNGAIVDHKGNLPHGFAQNCKEIGHKTPFSGVVKVYTTRSGTKLKFSKNVPHKVQQRIRNVFPHQSPKSKHKKRA
ncbi:DUF3634 family protein [Vibrio sp. TH_r3]|uniref:DUF3634 family protein n=1 Tax=Vibrio sp. TH_r3 TaxID=3082084 RepID=UPI0029537AB2|nr:DUF3634 family protein [Vibrio sp. TH_r3]MDV7104362.1 DUF3634 family protein [Vibrio sp. TH_r3]